MVGASVDAVTSAPHVHLGVRIAADPDGYVDPLGLLPALVLQPPPAPPSEPVPPSSDSPAAPAPPTTAPVTPTAQSQVGSSEPAASSAPQPAAPALAEDGPVAEAVAESPITPPTGTQVVRARPPAVPSTLRAEPTPTPGGAVRQAASREGIERRHAERARHAPGGSARPRPDLHTRPTRAEADPCSTEAGSVRSEPPIPRRDPESAPRRQSPSGDAKARGGRRGIRPRPARAHVRRARARGQCRRPGQAQACAYHEWG